MSKILNTSQVIRTFIRTLLILNQCSMSSVFLDDKDSTNSYKNQKQIKFEYTRTYHISSNFSDHIVSRIRIIRPRHIHRKAMQYIVQIFVKYPSLTNTSTTAVSSCYYYFKRTKTTPLHSFCTAVRFCTYLHGWYAIKILCWIQKEKCFMLIMSRFYVLCVCFIHFYGIA